MGGFGAPVLDHSERLCCDDYLAQRKKGTNPSIIILMDAYIHSCCWFVACQSKPIHYFPGFGLSRFLIDYPEIKHINQPPRVYECA